MHLIETELHFTALISSQMICGVEHSRELSFICVCSLIKIAMPSLFQCPTTHLALSIPSISSDGESLPPFRIESIQ
jgi:hypothetical protein